MCMIDGADGCEVYSSGIRKARKEHRCDDCFRAIAIGETYTYTFFVAEGCSSSCHTCKHCASAAEWLVENCGGYLIGGILEDLSEHVIEYPALAEGLNALCAGITSKWRAGDGLAPLPTIPASIQSTLVETAP